MSIVVQGVRTLLQVFDMPRSVAFYRDELYVEDPDGYLLCFQSHAG